MDIFELLSFDFGEFITSPASICIIIGCLFLIVGIALYFKENKKLQSETETMEEPKNEVAESNGENAPEIKTEEVTPVVNNTPVVVPTEGDGVKEVEQTPVAETINFDSVATVEKLDSTPVESLDTTPVTEPVTPVVETPVVEPVVETPVVDTSTIVAPVVESLDEPETPVVYGGVSPEPVTEVLEEKPREIYGGANPLENTAPIPAETVREAYAGAVVTPVEETEPTVAMPTPVVETPVVEAPAVEPAVETPVVETQIVEPTPVVEPAAPEQPTEEVEKLEF